MQIPHTVFLKQDMIGMDEEKTIKHGEIIVFGRLREVLQHMQDMGFPEGDIPFAKKALTAGDRYVAFEHGNTNWFETGISHDITVFQIKKTRSKYYARVTVLKNVMSAQIPSWTNWRYGDNYV